MGCFKKQQQIISIASVSFSHSKWQLCVNNHHNPQEKTPRLALQNVLLVIFSLRLMFCCTLDMFERQQRWTNTWKLTPGRHQWLGGCTKN